MTSKVSPASTRLTSAPTVSLSMMSLFPLAFSYSGPSVTTLDLKAPAVSTLSSNACADDKAPPITPASMSRVFLWRFLRGGPKRLDAVGAVLRLNS